MKQSFIAIISLLFIISVFSVCAQGPKEIHKTFGVKKLLRMEISSGDCTIRGKEQNEITVDIVYDVRPEDAFEPEFQEKSDELKIRERWHGHTSGKVTWTIGVPRETNIRFSSASGDLSLEGIKGEVDGHTASGDVDLTDLDGELKVNTASGDIRLTEVKGVIDFSTASGDIRASNMNGEIEMSTASGDIRLREASGSFDFSCASGDIEASGLVLREESSFSTASGDVDLKLAESAQADLDCSAASGDVVLDYKGNELKGLFELTTKKHGGRISAPVDFDKEEEYDRGGTTYVKKSFSKGGTDPLITLSTASGNVELKK